MAASGDWTCSPTRWRRWPIPPPCWNGPSPWPSSARRKRRAGQRGAAREHLAEALDLAARCGAQPLAARVREELNAAGARPRRDWRRGVESLTPTELRVARLAADGRTNREIAQTLYVTLKTVEGHLARVYAKLEINGRPQLAIVLGEENPRGPAR